MTQKAPEWARRLLYVAVCAIGTLASAWLFMSYMRYQTGGEWSAPLDDVFIHFDYARAIARGFPFQWTEGNGYSSGNTSITYPFALALGYWAGFRGPALMLWSTVVAAICTLGFLWSCRRFAQKLPLPAHLLLPICVLSIGALSWSLWSGMEVAWFLGVWALCAAVAGGLLDDALEETWGLPSLAASGVLLVLTRPEAATSLAVLGFAVATRKNPDLGWRHRLLTLVAIGLPAALALAGQAGVNYWQTGEASANGAIAKLAINHPYMTPTEKWKDYVFNLRYSFNRIHEHHFGHFKPWGWLPLLVAQFGYFDRRTRRPALILNLTALFWVLLVALNGQVRWQNERYLMPAVAWEMVAAALGLAVVIFPKQPNRKPLGIARMAVGSLLALAAMGIFWRGEKEQYRDQVWFFGRASRNIRDQHTLVGRRLAQTRPRPRRVLVGDAGAILYASDLPGYDIIGLGGYHRLPLARAGKHGIGAALEMIERVPKRDRPDYLAIYPTWFPKLPHWFGKRVFSMPVGGNVICGGAEKVVYRADWRLLNTGDAPRTLAKGERVADSIDVADLVSEKAHGYRFPRPQAGYVAMRSLPDPNRPEKDLWDAGRVIPAKRTEVAQLTVRRPLSGPRIIIRTHADKAMKIRLKFGSEVVTFAIPQASGWVELSIPIRSGVKPGAQPIEITPLTSGWVNYHLWLVGR